MKDQDRIAVIGGDMRQVYAAEHMACAGCAVCAWGLCDTPRGVEVCETPQDALQGATTVLLPLPLTKDRLQIHGTALTFSALFACLSPGAVIYCGMPPEDFIREAEQRDIRVTDYSCDEVFMIRNALPTAEGALAIAMNALSRTLYGSRALVIGYGRIGKLLSDLLVKLGACVTVAARKESDRAVASLHGCHWIPITRKTTEDDFKLPDTELAYHVIFNTAPARLLDGSVLRRLHAETVLIDLASAPGGIDYDEAAHLGLKTIIAQSLPGKVAPITAGEILADCLLTGREEGSPS